MRYAMAILALVVGVTAAAPAAMAQQNGPGQACYNNGVASSCVQPAPLYLGTGAGSSTVAGPGDSGQTVRPFYSDDTHR